MTIPHIFPLTWIYLNLPCNLDFSKSSPYFWVGAPSYPWPWTPYATDCCQELSWKPPTSLFSWRHPSKTFALRSFKSTFVSTRAKHNKFQQQVPMGSIVIDVHQWTTSSFMQNISILLSKPMDLLSNHPQDCMSWSEQCMHPVPPLVRYFHWTNYDPIAILLLALIILQTIDWVVTIVFTPHIQCF